MTIHQITQIHGHYSKLSVFERVAIERWRSLNPSIAYRFITDKDIDSYIQSNWGEHWEIYCQMSPICKAAIQRLAAVHRWGGMYADCGIYPLRPVSKFVPIDTWDQDFVLFKLDDRPNIKNVVTDSLFAAVKGHPLGAGLIEEIFQRTVNPEYKLQSVKEHPTLHYCFDYPRYVFLTASIHAYTDYAAKHGIKLIDGLADAQLSDLETRLESVNFLKHPTGSWLPENRFEAEGENQQVAELRFLTAIKDRAGI